MQIAILAQDPPLDREHIATGNQLRAAQLSEGLRRHGLSLKHLWFDQAATSGDPAAYTSLDTLRSKLSRINPDAILVAYWELLAFLPCDLQIPVVLDFLAPRPLEVMFEAPDEIPAELARLQTALRDVDHVLVGNDRQRHLLVPWLLAAGHDLREKVPVSVVPLAADLHPNAAVQTPARPFRLAAGGVSWPWRDDREYRRIIEEFPNDGAEPGFELAQFGGRYPHHREDGSSGGEVSDSELASYQHYTDFLSRRADIGLELGEPNTERHYSQSFRSLDFLRCGLPLICHRDLPIAAWVEDERAGWTVENPDEFRQLLSGLQNDPEEIRMRSENAIRLVRERLDVAQSVAPLIEFLNEPEKRQLLNPGAPEPTGVPAPRLPVPGFRQRIRRQLDLLRQALFARIRPAETTDAVVIISRGDLFPSNHGAAVKIIETARGLAANGVPVYLVTDDRKAYLEITADDIIRHRIPLWLRLLALPQPLNKLLHYSKDLPQSNAFLYEALSDRSFVWRTLYAGRKHGAQVFQAEFPGYCRPAIWGRSVLGGVAVLVQHNVEYERLRAQVPELTDAQYESLKAIEIGLCEQMDAVICVSDNDRRRLADDGVHPGRLITIPHGIDMESWRQTDGLEPAQLESLTSANIGKSTRFVVFHGTYSYPPNRKALNIFADELLPRWEDMGMDIRVLAIGKEPPAQSAHENIILTGPVDNLPAWLKAADVAVVPLTEGGGTRMKIIDYFAASVPVVSTAKGIEGIPVNHGDEALIVDDWQAMAESVAQVLSNPELHQQLTASADVIVRDLDWKRLGKRYLNVYGR